MLPWTVFQQFQRYLNSWERRHERELLPFAVQYAALLVPGFIFAARTTSWAAWSIAIFSWVLIAVYWSRAIPLEAGSSLHRVDLDP